MEMLLTTSRILVVDDDPATRLLLRRTLEKQGAQCLTASSGEEALSIIRSTPMDLVLTDIHMPGMGGLTFLKHLNEEIPVDVVVMTGDIKGFRYDTIIQKGAVDFLVKPLEMTEVVLRLQRVLRERCLMHELEMAHATIKHSYLDTVRRLVVAAEHKDEGTGDHIVRMGDYCVLLAGMMDLPDAFIELLRYASPMHDIGKIGIPDAILSKPGRLTDKEFNVIKTHTTIGAKILANSSSEVIRLGQSIALSHHERWDGSGYPKGITGEAIPLAGRIVCAADVFDTLTSRRPYKSIYPPHVVFEFFEKRRGEHFDPDITDLILGNFDHFLALSHLNHPDALPDDDSPFRLSERDIAEMR
ncbi:HD domain-containing phosphohydrolase [Desulfoluna sp.]|uniref:response regulator n=1 Tax=Desulfoluna sp. TaxID=2045199 RepID=UPI00260DE937|nr:HD domain-containing phosphohydrolase [Desulfoluna sp.]